MKNAECFMRNKWFPSATGKRLIILSPIFRAFIFSDFSAACIYQLSAW